MPVTQRKLSGEHVRDERICTLFGGRKFFRVLYI